MKTLEERLSDIENRLNKLESTPKAEAAKVDAVDINAEIKAIVTQSFVNKLYRDK